MKRPAFILLQAALWLALPGLCSACGTKIPALIQHDPPEMPAVDIGPFLEADCQADDYGYLACPAGSPPAALECSYLRAPDALLGGLQPAYPLVQCQLGYDKYPAGSESYIIEVGCLDHRWVQYVIFRGGGYQTLANFADFQASFAPVESQQEALSYALATTGLRAYFDLETPQNYRYEVEQIEETFVEQTDQGYRVLLFDYSVCGCGPHMFKAVTVNVTSDGGINREAPIDLFRDPELDDVCGD